MEKLTDKAEAILIECFGKDSLIALATTADNVPYVRTVDAFYVDGAFRIELTEGVLFSMGIRYDIDFNCKQ